MIEVESGYERGTEIWPYLEITTKTELINSGKSRHKEAKMTDCQVDK